MVNRFKNFALNFALILGSLLGALVVGELLLRFFLQKPPWEPVVSEHHKLFCEYDSLFGWRKIPHQKGWHRMEEYQVFEIFNSRGLRGAEYAYEKPVGVTRILILGDSFAEGYTVSFENLFSHVLESELNGTGTRRFEIINCGTAGYSTDQEFLFFQYEGKKYHPALTILLFSDNDPWFNGQAHYWRGYKPVYNFEGERLVLTNVPVPRPVDPSPPTDVETLKCTVLRRTKDWLNVHSYLYGTVIQRIERSYTLFSLAIKLGLTESNRSAEVPREFGVYRKVYDPESARGWQITEAILGKLNEEAASIGSKLVVFYVPSQACIDAKLWLATRRKYGLLPEQWDIEQISRELQRVCRQKNLPLIDPVAAFREETKQLARNGQRLYFEKDGHWNEHGHRLTGELIARYVREEYGIH